MLQKDILTCFAILEVESVASFKEVQSAYREMAKVWHPDRFPNDSKLQSKGQEKLKKINHAYKKLQEHFKNQEDCKVASSMSSKPQAAPSTDFQRDSTDNSYKKAANQESHIFNSNGFCTKCGFDRDFLTRTLRFQCKGYSKTTTVDLKTNKYDNRKQLEHDFILIKIYHSHWLFLALAVVAVVIAWIHTEIPRFFGQSHFVDLVSGRTFQQVIRGGYFGLLMVLGVRCLLAEISTNLDQATTENKKPYLLTPIRFGLVLWIGILTTFVVFSVKLMLDNRGKDLFFAKAIGVSGFLVGLAIILYLIICWGVTQGPQKTGEYTLTLLRLYHLFGIILIVFSVLEGSLIAWHIAKQLI